MHNKLIPAFFIIFILLPFSTIFSQEKKDTVFFDEDWSICEQPVAAYYRVCILNRDEEIFYKGDVIDYYINGKIEMEGQYSEKGYKDGSFIFYNAKNKILKQGNYLNDEMFGDWFYYDSTGNLKTILNCKSATDFTPVLIVDDNNDTLLKTGNGKFFFNAQKDLPFIFPVAEEYLVEGEVIDTLKNGVFNFYISQKHGKPAFSEIYKNGKFIKGKSYNATINTPLKLLHLTNNNLRKIDMFYHSNPVFGLGANGDQKVINFLLNNEFLGIESSSQSFYDNDRIIFDVIAKVLRYDLYNNANTQVSYNYPSSNPSNVYYSFNAANAEKNPLRKVEGDIALTIDTTRQVINSAFNTTLTKSEIDKINYYLFRIKGMVPYQNDNQKFIININLKLNTIIDTLDNSTLNAMYYIYNPDSTDKNSLAGLKGKNLLVENAGVQIEAKFPGGSDAWQKYLERNLNAQAPSNHRAPNGNYTVTVSFMIDTEGNVSDVKAENDPGYGTAEEAVRVIKKGPKWQPAIKDGKNVPYRQKQNFTFQVSGQ